MHKYFTVPDFLPSPGGVHIRPYCIWRYRPLGSADWNTVKELPKMLSNYFLTVTWAIAKEGSEYRWLYQQLGLSAYQIRWCSRVSKRPMLLLSRTCQEFPNPPPTNLGRRGAQVPRIHMYFCMYKHLRGLYEGESYVDSRSGRPVWWWFWTISFHAYLCISVYSLEN